MKLPWKKNGQESTLPPEIQQYYQDSKSGRSSVAWVLALASLLATVALGIGVFFASRWVYRKIAGTEKTTTVVTTKPVQVTTVSETPKPTSSPSTSSTTSSEDLANTGPGETVALFSAVTIMGVAFYEVKLRRKTV